MSTVFFNLRIDEKLNDELAAIAIEEGRSKNKQIEYILKEYVKSYLRENSLPIKENDTEPEPHN